MGKVADAHWDAPWNTQEDSGMTADEIRGKYGLDPASTVNFAAGDQWPIWQIAALGEIAAQLADLNATLKQAFFLRGQEDQPDIDASGDPPRNPPEKE